jgi:hypothetical protein
LSKASYLEYVPVMLKFLLSRVAETDKGLLQVPFFVAHYDLFGMSYCNCFCFRFCI